MIPEDDVILPLLNRRVALNIFEPYTLGFPTQIRLELTAGTCSMVLQSKGAFGTSRFQLYFSVVLSSSFLLPIWSEQKEWMLEGGQIGRLVAGRTFPVESFDLPFLGRDSHTLHGTCAHPYPVKYWYMGLSFLGTSPKWRWSFWVPFKNTKKVYPQKRQTHILSWIAWGKSVRPIDMMSGCSSCHAVTLQAGATVARGVTMLWVGGGQPAFIGQSIRPYWSLARILGHPYTLSDTVWLEHGAGSLWF